MLLQRIEVDGKYIKDGTLLLSMVETVASQAIDVINRIGIIDVVVLFMIGAGSMFGILEKVGMFGKDRHDINAMISIAIGLIIALNPLMRDFIFNFVPLVIVLALFLFIALLLYEWVGVEPKFFVSLFKSPAIFIPMVIIILVLVLVGNMGGLSLIIGETNYTGPMGVPSDQVTPEDLANPAMVLAQPQVAGTILIFTVFAVVGFMITQGK